LPFVEVDGRGIAPSERLRTSILTIQPGYFRAMGIRLLRGRDFRDADQTNTPFATIINESLARRYFPNEDPVGNRLRVESWTFFGPRTLEIVGIAADVKHRGLTEVQPMVYVPLAQYPRSDSPVVVRTIGEPMAFVDRVRTAVASLDRDQPVYNIQTLEQRIGQSLGKDRFSALLLGIFSIVAVMLAAFGLYGVVSYAVSCRTQEIGIRVALGADTRDLRLIVGQGMGTAVAGIALGITGTLALTRFVEALLFGVSATDPWTLGSAIVLLMLVTFVACWIPARAVVNVDPVVALRYQ
jgi:putative ABC transport system permease protein